MQRLSRLILNLQIILCTHLATSAEAKCRRACANVRTVLAHVSQRGVNLRFMQLAMTAGILTHELQDARDRRSPYLNFGVNQAVSETFEYPWIREDTPLMNRAVRHICEDEHGL